MRKIVGEDPEKFDSIKQSDCGNQPFMLYEGSTICSLVNLMLTTPAGEEKRLFSLLRKQPYNLNINWCRREDSNFHEDTPTRP